MLLLHSRKFKSFFFRFLSLFFSLTHSYVFMLYSLKYWIHFFLVLHIRWESISMKNTGSHGVTFATQTKKKSQWHKHDPSTSKRWNQNHRIDNLCRAHQTSWYVCCKKASLPTILLVNIESKERERREVETRHKKAYNDETKRLIDMMRKETVYTMYTS